MKCIILQKCIFSLSIEIVVHVNRSVSGSSIPGHISLYITNFDCGALLYRNRLYAPFLATAYLYLHFVLSGMDYRNGHSLFICVLFDAEWPRIYTKCFSPKIMWFTTAKSFFVWWETTLLRCPYLMLGQMLIRFMSWCCFFLFFFFFFFFLFAPYVCFHIFS